MCLLRVHNELFGGYEGDLMLKPDEATLFRVRGSFLEFLKREDLEPLKVLLKTSQELTGHKCFFPKNVEIIQSTF